MSNVQADRLENSYYPPDLDVSSGRRFALRQLAEQWAEEEGKVIEVSG